MDKQNNNAKNINEVLATIKTELAACKLKKTGNNKFAGFNYFELGDFLPQLTAIIHKYGANDLFSIENDGQKDWAVLHFYYNGEVTKTMMPFKEFPTPKGMQDIQYLGGEMTYYRRYLYMQMFNITDADLVDSLDNTKVKPKTTEPAKKERTPEQLAQKLSAEQTEFLVKNGYTGNTSNLTVADAIKITEELKKKPVKTDKPEPADERQKAQLQKYINEGKWKGDPNTLTYQEASEAIKQVILRGKEE